MQITDQQRDAIRLEEALRHEIRKEFAAQKPAPTFLDRCSVFLDSKAGFWLLTTVLAGLAGTGYASFHQYVNRADIEKKEAIQKSQRDFETVLKVGPMLTSEKKSSVAMGIQLLDALVQQNALDKTLKGHITAIFDSTVHAGSRHDATPAEKMQAEAVLAHADKARVAEIQQPGAATSATALPAAPVLVSTTVLPPRVYIQIAAEVDRAKAENIRAQLRGAGIVAPGIELVPAKSAPQSTNFRYCEAMVDSATLEHVKSSLEAALKPAPKAQVLPAGLCGKVRPNHFELWLAKSQ